VLSLVAALTVATVAGSRLGADGGGALVLAGGYAVLAAALVRPGRRLRAAVVTVSALAVLLALDVALGPSTHLTESIRDGPAELVRDLWERMELSYLRATTSWTDAAAIVAALVALAALVSRIQRVPAPESRLLLAAFATAIALSLLVNDSPREVAVGGLVGYLALLAYVHRPPRLTYPHRVHLRPG
jgi:hypothetical protein